MAGAYASSLKHKAVRLRVLYHLINHGTYRRGAIGHALDSSVYRPCLGVRHLWMGMDFVIQRYYISQRLASDIGDKFRKTGCKSGFLRNINLDNELN